MNSKNENHPAETPDPPEPAKTGEPKRRSTTAFFAQTGTEAERRLPRGLLVIAFSLVVLVLVCVIFNQLAGLLKPLFIAALVCYLIMPARRFLGRFRIPPVLSYVFMLLFIVVVAFAIFRVAFRSAEEMKEKFPVYTEKVNGVVAKANAWLDRIKKKLDKLRPGKTENEKPANEGKADSKDEGKNDGKNENKGEGELFTRKHITEFLGSLVGNTIGFLVGLLVIVVYLMFLIAEAETFSRRIRTVFGDERGETILQVVGDINTAISQYLGVKTLISFTVALCTTVVLGVFGVDFFLLWGILAFLFNFVPYLGSVVAAGLPIAQAFLQFGLGFRFIAVAVLLLAAQNFIGYVVEPRLTGKKLDLSPLMILLSLAFWGWLWGIVGMILAVPLVVSLKIILDHIDSTRPIAGLMSNIPVKIKP